jgi:hypothetical protein
MTPCTSRVKGVERPLKLLHDTMRNNRFQSMQERSLQTDAFNMQQEVAIKGIAKSL